MLLAFHQQLMQFRYHICSLEIRTDPLRVIYQHELLMEISKFFETARAHRGYQSACLTYD